MSDNKNPALHDGHRDRVRRRFTDDGLEKFLDHQVIELLLFYGIPRKDTNEIAHNLINRFGSFSGVFDAPIESLMESGLSYNAAVLLKLIPAVSARYCQDRYQFQEGDPDESETDSTGRFIVPYFIGKNEEQVMLLLYGAKGKRIFMDVISKGTVTGSDVNIKKIMHACIQHKASGAIVAHNHPSGIALPSKTDKEMTKKLKTALSSIGVILFDHYIVADAEYCAMSELTDCMDIFY